MNQTFRSHVSHRTATHLFLPLSEGAKTLHWLMREKKKLASIRARQASPLKFWTRLRTLRSRGLWRTVITKLSPSIRRKQVLYIDGSCVSHLFGGWQGPVMCPFQTCVRRGGLWDWRPAGVHGNGVSLYQCHIKSPHTASFMRHFVTATSPYQQSYFP